MKTISISGKKYVIEIRENGIEGKNGKIYLPEIRKTVFEVLEGNKLKHIGSFPKDYPEEQIIEWINRVNSSK